MSSKVCPGWHQGLLLRPSATSQNGQKLQKGCDQSNHSTSLASGDLFPFGSLHHTICSAPRRQKPMLSFARQIRVTAGAAIAVIRSAASKPLGLATLMVLSIV